MAELFGIDLAGIINDALGPLVLEGTLSTVEHRRDSECLSGGWSKKIVRHGCRGFIDTKISMREGDALPAMGSGKVLILGASLPEGVVPDVSDLVEFEGITFTIKSIKRDPAAATYECDVDAVNWDG